MKLTGDFRYLKNTLGGLHLNDVVVREALYSLDAIDSKAASLLQFQGLVIAAATFTISRVPDLWSITGATGLLGVIAMGMAATFALLTINLLGPQSRILRKRLEHRRTQERHPGLVPDRMLLVYIFGMRRRFFILSYGLSFVGVSQLTLSVISMVLST